MSLDTKYLEKTLRVLLAAKAGRNGAITYNHLFNTYPMLLVPLSLVLAYPEHLCATGDRKRVRRATCLLYDVVMVLKGSFSVFAWVHLIFVATF